MLAAIRTLRHDRATRLALALTFSALACAEGNELPPTGSVGATGGGGIGSATSAASTTGAGGDGGASSAASAGGDGGASSTSGAGGDGGASSTASATASSTTSSSASTGTGGAPPAPGTLVALVGRGTTNGQIAQFDGGWSTPQALSIAFDVASMRPTAAGGLAAFRVESATPAADNELFAAAYTGSLATPAKIGNFGFALGGPTAAEHGVAELVLFLGTDNKHYFSQRDGGVFGAFQPLPGGSMGTQSFGPSAAALVAAGPLALAAYAGGDGKLYTLTKAGPGSAFGLATQVPGTSTVDNTIPPVGLADPAGDLALYYVRQADRRIGRVVLDLPANVWGPELVVHTDAITDRTPSVVVTSQGDQLVAWHGNAGNQGIYATRGTTSFGAPVVVDAATQPTSAPVLAANVDGGADAELLYVRGGALVHARPAGTSYPTQTVAGVANAQVVAGVTLP